MLKKLLFLAALALFPATAHAQAPNVIPGCVYNSTPPTLADKQTVAIQCDSAGKLKTTGGSIGPGVATTCTASTLLYADAASLLQCSKTIPFNGAVSAPALAYNGTWFSGGSATTTKPYWLIEPSGTTSTGWSTGGTGLGINQPSGFAGSPIDVQFNGVPQWTMLNNGEVTQIGTLKTTGGSVWIGSNTAGLGFLIGATGDVQLVRDAANTLAQRNGVNAQTANFYRTYTDASNYQTAQLGSDGNGPYLKGIGAGTGNGANLSVLGQSVLFMGGNNTAQWEMTLSGHFLALADNTYDIGAVGATRPRNIYIGGNLNAATGVIIGPSNTLAWSGAGTIFGNATTGALTGTTRISGSTDAALNFGGDTASFPALKRSATILQARLANDSLYAPFEADTVRTVGYTVAGLPAAGTAGRRAYVTNQLTVCAAAGAALTGGGAVVCPVFDNGVAWVGD